MTFYELLLFAHLGGAVVWLAALLTVRRGGVRREPAGATAE